MKGLDKALRELQNVRFIIFPFFQLLFVVDFNLRSNKNIFYIFITSFFVKKFC